MSRLVEHVSALTPLAQTIDGQRRTQPRRRPTTQGPKNGRVGVELFCPFCDYRTDDDADHRRHLIGEIQIARSGLLREMDTRRLPGHILKRCPCRRRSSEPCDIRHGSWYWVADAEPHPDGKRRQVMRGGYGTRSEAAEALLEFWANRT